MEPFGRYGNTLFPINQLATRKTRFDLVPKLDTVLAISPTQVHLPAIVQSDEVYQPNTYILDLYSHILNSVEESIEAVKIWKQPA